MACAGLSASEGTNRYRSKFRATVRSLAKGTQPEELAGALAEEPAAGDRGGPAGSGDF